MSDVVEPLLLDLLEWISRHDRRYEEVLDAWRTSCPRLPVWEEAQDRGFVARDFLDGCTFIRVTPSGTAFLQQRRPHAGK
jgi:hypothetical protein